MDADVSVEAVDDVRGPQPRGRKRLYAADVERRMIVEAAIRVMRRNSFVDARFTEIITEAKVSNRAFYRHFRTKDEVLLAVVRDQSEAVLRNLEARVADAPDPLSAVRAYVDEYLSIYFDPMKQERVGALSADQARQVPGFHAELRHLERIQTAPLAEILRWGSREGVLRSDRPENDAVVIFNIVRGVSPSHTPSPMTRDEAVARVMDFVAGICIPPAQ